jgi:hypothetical protein
MPTLPRLRFLIGFGVGEWARRFALRRSPGFGSANSFLRHGVTTAGEVRQNRSRIAPPASTPVLQPANPFSAITKPTIVRAGSSAQPMAAHGFRGTLQSAIVYAFQSSSGDCRIGSSCEDQGSHLQEF